MVIPDPLDVRHPFGIHMRTRGARRIHKRSREDLIGQPFGGQVLRPTVTSLEFVTQLSRGLQGQPIGTDCVPEAMPHNWAVVFFVDGYKKIGLLLCVRCAHVHIILTRLFNVKIALFWRQYFRGENRNGGRMKRLVL